MLQCTPTLLNKKRKKLKKKNREREKLKEKGTEFVRMCTQYQPFYLLSHLPGKHGLFSSTRHLHFCPGAGPGPSPAPLPGCPFLLPVSSEW
jgi:hypothetical protein